MQPRIIAILLGSVVILSGCVAPLDTEESSDIPLQLAFTADTLDRAEDGDSEFVLKQSLESKPVLILWIAAGCSGCHDWTQLIRESIDNGSLSNSVLSVVSMHRWANIESPERVMEVFGEEDNNSNYTPWPIVIPQESDKIVDFDTGVKTTYTVVEGFNNPGTPTVQLIGQDGVKMWQSKSYWANYSMLQEAWNVAELISSSSTNE
ncbi:MAG TPA: hypothetical protein HA327_01840 [Candidatus Poseidoniaceae archaeon]|nr:MAG TPA: hypothetical protein D7H81_01820 [Candidatus Poseidoniales archaeon]HII44757.1 hypothetical protein [Candidatus Poseidoniaceae archaeon]|tara:strand:- start:3984 stop:4601 length:618 start_codon:yes stop_codon:yes gene_type:complete